MICSLTSWDLSNSNNVNNMSYMFYDCSSLTSLNLSNNVNNMSYGCSSLISLDLSNLILIMLIIWVICSMIVLV